jgi:outer membrane protein assembly factor BamB
MTRKTKVPGPLFAAASVLALWAVAAGASDWTRWGGPEGNFTVDAGDLADAWPADGPRRIWSRPLGEGYSAILVAGDALYTMVRRGDREVVVALDAESGQTRWEHEYDSPTDGADWNFDRGPGPHATPAIANGRIFTAGSTGKFQALDLESGSRLWSYDFLADFEGSFRHRGYSSSPLVFEDLVIAGVGGQGRALVAFRQSDGTEAWRGGDDDNSYSSPILIELDGQAQVVALAANAVFGLDPRTGRTLWSHAHPTRNAFNISTPVWSDDGLLFLSSAYDGGGRTLRLTREGGSTTAEELWFSNQMRVHFGTAIRIDDTVYASSGDFGPAPMTAVDVASGDILWRDRTFAKHSLLRADDKLVLLDEDGVLALVRVDRAGMEVLDQAQIFESLAWTVPTLVGTRLYARTRETIVALELGE